MKKTLILTLLIFFFTMKISFASPRIYVDPSSVIDTSLEPGDQFSIDVKVDDVTNLAGFEFKLYYNKSVLSIVSVSPRPENLWSSNFQWTNLIDNTGGYYYVSYSRKLPSSDFSGDASLTIITFRVENSGVSILDITKSKLGNSGAFSITHEISDGVFSNYPCNSDGSLQNGQCHESCGANPFCNFRPVGTTIDAGTTSDCLAGDTHTKDKCSNTCQRGDTNICDYDCNADWSCDGRLINSTFCYYGEEKVTCNLNCNSVWEYCRYDAIDSDNNQNFTAKGTCTDYQGCLGGECYNITYTDYCINDTTTKEYYTQFGYDCSYVEKNCMEIGAYYSCIDGKCKFCIGDANADNKVDMQDLVVIINAYGSTPSDPNWNQNSDIDDDNDIDMQDLITAINVYGKQCT